MRVIMSLRHIIFRIANRHLFDPLLHNFESRKKKTYGPFFLSSSPNKLNGLSSPNSKITWVSF